MCTGSSSSEESSMPLEAVAIALRRVGDVARELRSTNLRRSTKRKGGGWLQGWHRVAGSGGLCAMWQAGVCHAGHSEGGTAGLRARRAEAKVHFFGNEVIR